MGRGAVAWVRMSALAGFLGDTVAWVKRVHLSLNANRDTVAWVRVSGCPH